MNNVWILYTYLLFIYPLGEGAQMDFKTALKELKNGNERFVSEKLLHPRRDQEILRAVQEEQKPIAVILSCSDSRAAPEIIFDQGIGDLFIVRIAGNILSSFGLESIKFAILALKTSLIVVLGHQDCGAVKAVVQSHTALIPQIAEQIEQHCKSQDLIECIKENVKGVVQDLKKDKELKSLIEQSKIAIVGGYYELGTGRVSFFEGT